MEEGDGLALEAPAPPALTLDLGQNGIGSPEFQSYKLFDSPLGPGVDYHLDFGGWSDAFQTQGDVAYLADRYTQQLYQFASVANGLQVPPPSPKPDMSVTPSVNSLPPSPMIYAEVEWGGTFARLDAERVAVVQDIMKAFGLDPQQDSPTNIGEMPDSGLRNFAPSNNAGVFTGLDDYIVITYYVFYPAAVPLHVIIPDNKNIVNLTAPRKHEGQWEAISVFLSSSPERSNASAAFSDPDAGGRPSWKPDAVDPSMPLIDFGTSYVIYTRGWSPTNNSDWGRLRTTCARNFLNHAGFVKQHVERVAGQTDAYKVSDGAGTHPVAYVAMGSHEMLFAPASQIVVYGQTGDNLANQLIALLTSLLAVVAAAAAAAPPTAGASLVIALIALIFAILAFIIALIASLIDVANGDNGGKISTELPGDAAGASGGFILCGSTPSPTPTTVVLTTPDIVISGFANVSTALFTINQYDYPGQVCDQAPPFWRYAGRWGAPMISVPSPSSTSQSDTMWTSSDRRTDVYERSLGYWNAVGLVSAVLSQTSCPDFASPTPDLFDSFPGLRTGL